MAGTVAAGLLSLVFLRLPMLVSAVGFLLLAGWVWLVMPEEHFNPTPVQRRETFRHMGDGAGRVCGWPARGPWSAGCC